MTHTTAGAARGTREGERTLAQWFCYLVGAVLVLAGLFGFLADATFDTGDGLQGDTLLGLEVNGWHNLVHIASGIFLLAMARKRSTARLAAIAFGAIYALVTLIGLIDGSDIFGIMPINGPDNVLHVVLAAAGIATGLMSPAGDTTGRPGDRSGTQGGRFDRSAEGTDETAPTTPGGGPPSVRTH